MRTVNIVYPNGNVTQQPVNIGEHHVVIHKYTMQPVELLSMKSQGYSVSYAELQFLDIVNINFTVGYQHLIPKEFVHEDGRVWLAVVPPIDWVFKRYQEIIAQERHSTEVLRMNCAREAKEAKDQLAETRISFIKERAIHLTINVVMSVIITVMLFN